MRAVGNKPERPAPHHGGPTDAMFTEAAATLALLTDPTRLRMLWSLKEGERDVTTLAEIAGVRPTVASQHLSKLRLFGLVEGRREGRRILYRLRGAHVRGLLTEALFQADHQVRGEPTHD